ncbi:MAG TPA: peptidoglycan-binding domain-containing protein [Hyphomicrobium sp.]|nr:peptidoglycan-binding domain-containing protein [Hyphomicrobium sp.]
MLPGRLKLQFAAFFLLSGGLAANLLFLQPMLREEAAQRASAPGDSWLADAQMAGFGDTGSITRADTPAAAAKPSAPNVIEAFTKPDTKAALPADATEVTRAVQRELQIRGYETGGADGAPTLMTRAAIMGFEYDHALPMTGKPSQRLLKAIVLGESTRTTRPIGSSGQSSEAADLIRSVQSSLAKAGYKPGRATGKLSPETMRAIRAFETDQSLPETGRISGPLISRLARISGDGKVASGL